MRKPALRQPYRKPQYANYPEPGFFRLKLKRGGPWVPALIWAECPMVQDHELPDDPSYWCLPTDPNRGPRWLRARILDDEVDPLEVWVRGRKITWAEWDHRVRLGRWARDYAPDQPEANPRKPVDLTRVASIF